MANEKIKFLRGLQANYDAITSKSADSFYVTTDSHRLYLGSNLLSQAVLTYASEAALQTAIPDGNGTEGQFYYLIAENILAVYTGGEWVQINKQSSDVHISSMTATATSVSTNGGKITITSKMNDNSDGPSCNFEFVGTGAAVIGKNSDGKITVHVDDKKLGLVADHTIALGVADDADKHGTVALIEGNNVTLTDNATNGTISIASKDFSTQAVDVTSLTAGFQVKVTDADNSHKEDSIDPVIKVGVVSAKQQDIHFASGTATLPVYTSAEVDEKLIGINAMVYQGTIGSGGTIADVPTSGVHIGDTYKLLDADLISSNKPGDMIIARGTEGSAGTITSNLTWDLIPSGDDIDDYSLVGTTHGAQLKEGNAGKGSFTLAEGSHITLTDSGTDAAKVVTVAHAAVGTGSAITPTADEADEYAAGGDVAFTALTGLEIDSLGHVAGATKQQLKITHNKLDNVETHNTSTLADVTSSSGVYSTTFSGKIWAKDAANRTSGGTVTLGFKSSSLVLSKDSDGKLNIDLEWGSF